MGREEEDYPGASSLSSSWSVESVARPSARRSLKGRERKRAKAKSTFSIVDLCRQWRRRFESRRRSTALSRLLFVPLACFSSLRAYVLRIRAKERAFLGPGRGEQRSTKKVLENQSTSEERERERERERESIRVGKALSRLFIFFSLPPPQPPSIPTNRRGGGAPRERGVQDLEEEHAVSVW